MELNEMQKALVNIGVSEKLIKMPAVMERLRRLLSDCRSEEEIKEQLSIGEDGVITIVENPFEKGYEKRSIVMKVTEKESGARIDIHGPYDYKDEFSTNIEVDERGVDRHFISYGEEGNSHWEIFRENGIIVSEPFDVITGGHPSRFADNGEPCLADSFEKVQRRRTLEENMEYYSTRYPETLPFFYKLKEIKEKRRVEKFKDGEVR